MKKATILFILLSIVFFSTSCKTGKEANGAVREGSEKTRSNKENTQWWGCYFATIPCSDCEGIEMQLSLTRNSNYNLIITEKGKQGSRSAYGSISWDKTGTTFVLNGITPEKEYQQWKLQEGKLMLLDTTGNIRQEAEKYTLTKIAKEKYNPFMLNKYWRLSEIGGKEPVYFEGNSEVEISFSTDAKIFGSLGCNNFNAIFTLEEGNKISITKILRTKKLCKEMLIEKEMLVVLEKIYSFDVVNGELIFKDINKNNLVKFKETYAK